MRIAKCVGVLLGALVCSGFCDSAYAQRPQRFIRLDIVFEDNCDGMDLRLGDGGFAIGSHTGCNAGEIVVGTQFDNGDDDETGVSVLFFERASRLPVRYDIYRTGFRAGRFYVYLAGTDRLLRNGEWSPAPLED